MAVHGGPWRSMSVHVGRKKVSTYMFLAVVRLVAVFKRTMQAYWKLTECRRHFPLLGETLQCRKSSKKLTEKTPRKNKNNKLRKFKVLRHGNTGDKLASQKPAKTVTPAFSFDCTKCGQVWTSNVVYLRAVKVSLTKGKIHTLLCKR